MLISKVRGEAPPPSYKVSLSSIGGFRNEVTFVLTGLDIEAKARLAREQVERGLARRPAELRWTPARTDRADAGSEEEASALPETAGLPVTRHLLPNLRALNFVVEGMLGAGVASRFRFDPQAKAVGEWLRSRHIDIPAVLL